MLHGKGALAGVIKLRILRWKDNPGGGPAESQESLQVKEGGRRMVVRGRGIEVRMGAMAERLL